MSADDDGKLLQYGIGFTNIVERTTRGSSNLTRKEIEEGTFKRNSLSTTHQSITAVRISIVIAIGFGPA